MKVYTPVKNASGVWCNTVFINGQGECTDPYLLERFLHDGYRLEFPQAIVDGKVLVDEAKVDDDNIDPKTLSALELREWLLARGYGRYIRNTKAKDKLLEFYYSNERYYIDNPDAKESEDDA